MWSTETNAVYCLRACVCVWHVCLNDVQHMAVVMSESYYRFYCTWKHEWVTWSVCACALERHKHTSLLFRGCRCAQTTTITTQTLRPIYRKTRSQYGSHVNGADGLKGVIKTTLSVNQQTEKQHEKGHIPWDVSYTQKRTHTRRRPLLSQQINVWATQFQTDFIHLHFSIPSFDLLHQ